MNSKDEINNRLEILEARLREINLERKDLLNEIRSLRQHDDVLPALFGKSLDLNNLQTPQEKIDLFLKLFRCRDDVYPRYWESKNKKGYSPVCSNEWVPGICNKPKVKCSDCSGRSFVSFSEIIAKKHLQGFELIGSYSITNDGKCVFLVADFDKSTWKEDIVAYKMAAREIGVEVYLERSKSGNGGHAWIFFDGLVPAYLARQLGTIILTLASARRPKLSLGSYDRFFPNQDTVPKGGFGNLIALGLKNRTTAEFVLPRIRDWRQGYQARALKTFCIGIGITPIRFHDLRACFATQLLQNRVAPATVMKICGWKELDTMARYIRLAGIDESGATDSLQILSDVEASQKVVSLFRGA